MNSALPFFRNLDKIYKKPKNETCNSSNKNQVLLARRRNGQNLQGYWEFPGGKIEKNETPQKCLERELLEELSVKSKAGEIIVESVYNYESGSIKLIGIETVLLETNITLSVHDKIQWVTIKNILQYKLAPADIPIAKYLINKR